MVPRHAGPFTTVAAGAQGTGAVSGVNPGYSDRADGVSVTTWTAHPATLIEGVQGRYFVMTMVLMGYVLSGLAKGKTRLQGRLAALALSGFALCSLTALSMTLLSRYH